MYNKAKNYAYSQPYLRRVFGFTLLALGFLALITPLTPGALLMLVGGLEFLGIRILFLDRLVARVRAKKGE